MKTKQEIQIELLQEIDEICLKNNLKYIFVGINALNAYLNNTIKNNSRLVSIAMTQGDIDRFCEIVEKSENKDRYVEGIFNNSNFLPIYVNYGNKNTTDFHMLARNKNKHHGISVRIYPIQRSVTLDGEEIEIFSSRLSKERKMREFMNKTIENRKFYFIKVGLNLFKGVYSLTGGGKRYYKTVKKKMFIDKWEDIQNYSKVRIINRKIESKYLKEIGKIEFDNIQLPIPKDTDAYFSEIFGEEFKDIKIKVVKPMRVIVDTEIGYEEIMEETKDILQEAKATREEVMWERLKVYNEKVTVDNVWKLVKMTDRQIKLKEKYEENIDNLLTYDLKDEEQFEELYDELRPAINSLKRYSKLGMTFSINPKTDTLIEKVLIKNGEKKLVNKINKLAKKEYFIE
ncbi:LicD family protein [Methanobrevibacter olleyae]|uniref:Phosphorylcholine metabolism protein LicD n=1 Tax=Methanobrevibacter olleyae TaxID=294671 RepID=A0A126R2A7_METOL|nr:LicD family protein [Methanobrevibacter olleyae]AMK16192.1 hypothetical protein YLM1_1637 [Methanobrevibacter olleyae]SFL52962.1 Phosphorylcholine metabolism protein LicD [Methanobrevibacter olleyae]